MVLFYINVILNQDKAKDVEVKKGEGVADIDNKDDNDKDEEIEDKDSKNWKRGVEEKNNISILNDENFDDYLNDFDAVFVVFQTSWCGHCKGIESELKELAQDLKNRKKDDFIIAIATIDAEENPETAKKYNVTSYPTMKLFTGDEIIEYSSKFRDKDSILYFIRKKVDYETKQIESEEDYELLTSENLAVVLYFPKKDEETKNTFIKLALKNENIPFYSAYDLNIIEEFNFEEKYGLMIFRKFDSGNVVKTSNTNFSYDDMEEFLNEHKTPVVYDFNVDAVNEIFKKDSTSIFLFTEKRESEFVNNFNEVAKELKGQFHFVLSNLKSGFGERLAKFADISPKNDPSLRLFDLKDQTFRKYKLDSYSKSTMIDSINKWKEGTLEEYFKSQPVPIDNDKNVKIVVGTTYEEMVINNSKHVLILLHAPWNGYSKKFYDIFDEIAEKVKEESSIVLAKMDVTENEYSGLDVKALPTLYLYKNDDKENPIWYNKERK